MHDVLPADPVEPAAFRKLMGQFATGVCVVAAPRGGGGVSGITVNSFVSVSLDPMLVCWSIQNQSSQFDFWAQAPGFTISILNEDQGSLARRYAARGDTESSDDDFIQSASGLPVVSDAIGHLECRQWSLYPVGDHTMVFGEVVGMSAVDGGRPLGFFGGAFCRISDSYGS
ncbi:MAG: flavin reductase family protein [Pseudomonadota bacterium]